MKKLFLMLVVMLALIICLCGCSEIDPNADATIPQVQASVEKNTVKRPTVPHSLMEASTIVVKNLFTEEEIVLEGHVKDDVLSILNDSGWEKYQTKTLADYCFVIDDTFLYYTVSQGLFNDRDQDMHLWLSEEQRAFINSLLGE